MPRIPPVAELTLVSPTVVPDGWGMSRERERRREREVVVMRRFEGAIDGGEGNGMVNGGMGMVKGGREGG